jgi:hypothetical protein
MKDKAGSVSKYFTKAGERLSRYRFDGDPIDGKRNVISKQGSSRRLLRRRKRLSLIGCLAAHQYHLCTAPAKRSAKN